MRSFHFPSLLCGVAVAALSVFSSAVGYSATVTLPVTADTTIAGGPSDSDTGGHQNTNFGGAATFAVGQVSYNPANPANYTDQRSLLRFDLSSLAGQYSSIDSITLRLYFSSRNGTLERRTEVYEIAAANAGWVEGVAGNTAGATWRHLDKAAETPMEWTGGSGLTTAGTAYNSALLSSYTFAVGSTEAVNDVIDFALGNVDLTNLVDAWVASMPGLLLLDALPKEASVLDRINYHSREETVDGLDLAPQLIVNYQPVPEPQSMILIISGLAAVATFHRSKFGKIFCRKSVAKS